MFWEEVMKQFILLVSTLLFCVTSFAESRIPNSTLPKMLGSALKNQALIHPAHGKNDLTIVYGGADIEHRPFAIPVVAS